MVVKTLKRVQKGLSGCCLDYNVLPIRRGWLVFSGASEAEGNLIKIKCGIDRIERVFFPGEEMSYTGLQSFKVTGKV